MADVTVDMETANLTVRGEAQPAPEKIRRGRFLSRETKAKLKALDAKIKAAAAKRGSWKDASPEDRAEAKRLGQEMAELKTEARAEQARAAAAESDKKAAAAERENSRNKAGG